MKKLSEIKSTVDLIKYAHDHYNLKVDDNGKGSCPFHPPDNNSSFSIFRDENGAWRWHDFHDGEGGTIVDLVSRLQNISPKEAIRALLEQFGEPRPVKKKSLEILREHIYLNAEGQPVFKKSKIRTQSDRRNLGLFPYG